MNKEIIEKLDEITNIIDNDKDIKEYKELEKRILNNKELLKKIDKLKSINSYGNDYIELKKEILLNKDYSRYLELEKKLFFDIKDINNRLNCLLEKSGCI